MRMPVALIRLVGGLWTDLNKTGRTLRQWRTLDGAQPPPPLVGPSHNSGGGTSLKVRVVAVSFRQVVLDQGSLVGLGYNIVHWLRWDA